MVRRPPFMKNIFSNHDFASWLLEAQSRKSPLNLIIYCLVNGMNFRILNSLCKSGSSWFRTRLVRFRL
jgi:hypothetical protein